MPAKKTDWKRLRQQLQGEGSVDTDVVILNPTPPNVIMEKGKRSSSHNAPNEVAYTITEFLAAMEANRRTRPDRKKAMRRKSHEDRLKGLFGGG